MGITITYKIQMHSFWHVGSGLTGGVVADSVVIKDSNGLPFIPGKTLKGLLRDAALTIQELNSNLISTAFIDNVFGQSRGAEGTNCFFSNAYLSNALQTQLKQDTNKDILYQNLASTAIDKNGQAVNGSLRTLEATIPLVLFAQIVDFPEEEKYQQELDYCMQMVKRMGSKRHRGLGRCDWSLIN
jgi:CRISPR/Cas system CSM-associated protein Csm3 (group 7 of RAMP superfamily)